MLLTDLSKTVEGMNALIAERLIGSVEPLPDEVKAVEDYKSAKEKGTNELVPWKKFAVTVEA